MPRLAGPWEPRSKGAPLAPEDAISFATRCGMRERERQLGSGFGFGIFLEHRFAGEITLSSIQRGPFQNGSIGYWIDQGGRRPRPRPRSRGGHLEFRLRDPPATPDRGCNHPPQPVEPQGGGEAGHAVEGVALGFLEINGAWEDHVRYAMTAEEWALQGARAGTALAGRGLSLLGDP